MLGQPTATARGARLADQSLAMTAARYETFGRGDVEAEPGTTCVPLYGRMALS
jgi:hypothetical protein